MPMALESLINRFITQNKLDKEVGDQLRNLPKKVQQKVINAGPPEGDASLEVLNRISNELSSFSFEDEDEDEGVNAAAGRGPASTHGTEDVEAFLAENPGVDERAQDMLRTTSPALAAVVMAGGPLAGAKNPSAALVNRLKNAQWGASKGEASWKGETWKGDVSWKGEGKGKMASSGASPQEVEQYLSENGVDSEAASLFRECDPSVQAMAMERGPVSSARNPSAMLKGRIRELGKGKGEKGKGEKGSKDAWGPSEEEMMAMFQEFLAFKGKKGMKGKGKGIDLSAGKGKGCMDLSNGYGKGGYSKGCAKGCCSDYGKGYGKGCVKGDHYGAGYAVPVKRPRQDADITAPSALMRIISCPTWAASQGLEPEAIALVWSKDKKAFCDAAWMLTDVLAEPPEIQHDPDWEQFPEIGEAIKEKGIDDCFAVARDPTSQTWAVGVAAGWKGREAASRLALAVALAAKHPEKAEQRPFAPLVQLYAAGGDDAALLVAGAQADTNGSSAGPFVVPSSSASRITGASGNVWAPQADWITLQESALLSEGCIPEAPVVVHAKEYQDLFSSAHNILHFYLSQAPEMVHDADWEIHPEVAEAAKAVGLEENCLVVAKGPSGIWAAGLAASWKNRESSGKLALAIAMARADPGKLAQIARETPDFITLCANLGLEEAQAMAAAGGKRNW